MFRGLQAFEFPSCFFGFHLHCGIHWPLEVSSDLSVLVEPQPLTIGLGLEGRRDTPQP